MANIPLPEPLDDATLHPVPRDEPERLRRVTRLAVSAGQVHPTLDHVTGLAAGLLGVPVALISIVEEERQWFLSRQGLDLPGTSRRESFCQFTIVSPSVMEIGRAHV